MAFIYDLDNEYGGRIIADANSTTPALEISSNASNYPSLKLSRVVGNQTCAPLVFANLSMASVPVMDFGNNFISVASIGSGVYAGLGSAQKWVVVRAGGVNLGLPLFGLSTAQTLTNKTLTSPKINENVALTSSATELNLLDGVTVFPVKAAGSDVTTGTDDAKFATAKALKDAHVLDHILSIPIVIVNGVGENTVSTTYDNMAYWKVSFDKTKYTNIVSITFQVLLQQDNAGTYAVYCQLVKVSGGAAITGSAVTASLGEYGVSPQESGDIAANLTAGAEAYQIQAKAATGGKCNIQYAAIVVNMKV